MYLPRGSFLWLANQRRGTPTQRSLGPFEGLTVVARKVREKAPSGSVPDGLVEVAVVDQRSLLMPENLKRRL